MKLQTRRFSTIAPGLLLLAACSGQRALPPAPAVDAARLAAQAERSNPVPATARAVFKWSITEPNLRIGGSGVMRLEPPDRARLDLFLGNGQSVLAVALVDDELRAPVGTPMQIVPSPPLLWASMGVFRPGAGATLLGAEGREEEEMRLRYRLPGGDELHYKMRGGQVVGVELLHDGNTVHRVELDREGIGGLPREAVYRNLASFRELKVTIESVENVESYPSDIWQPNR